MPHPRPRPPPSPPPPPSSAPPIGPQSNPVANTQVGCTLSSSSTKPTPASNIGSSIASTTANGNRLPLQVVGNDFDRDDCARTITAILKDRWDLEGHDWKFVTTDTENFYWEEFKVELE
ncbi:hypothetical protein JCGZ_10852 [Jatropha curcas]|uniref:Uncharacterized protein n=1 Tax=Jatropha curcas TaxID=180498 RepID=A0A067KUC3_JATCU|nr:hypothetical protein JCGZ_10852 [Jatropha curcas]